MHVRAATTALLAAAAAIVIAGCGGAAPAGSSGGGSTSSEAAVTGVVVQTDTSHPHGGKADAGVKVGLYLQPIHAGGPIAVDPPLQIATVMSATGSFDHRAIDGADGAKLMQAFKRLVENPLGMLA